MQTFMRNVMQTFMRSFMQTLMELIMQTYEVNEHYWLKLVRLCNKSGVWSSMLIYVLWSNPLHKYTNFSHMKKFGDNIIFVLHTKYHLFTMNLYRKQTF